MPASILIACSEPSVLTSSTCCLTIPRCTLSLLLSQSTSDHFRAMHSLIRRPKQTQSRAIVRNGSFRCTMNLWNSATVRLRGLRLRFDEPLTVTSSIGLRCVGTSPRHIANSHTMRSKPRISAFVLGASVSDCNHSSTGRACTSVIECVPQCGKIR
jgi:hypothetical protein